MASAPSGETPRPIHLQILWLTLVTLLLFAMLAPLSPDKEVGLSGHYARSAAQLRCVLHYNTGPAALNSFRASLMADLLFLAAYGFLLRATARRLGSRWAARASIGLMLADATENSVTLSLLRRLPYGNDHGDGWAYALMNAASVSKWLFAGVVFALLAYALWRLRRESRREAVLLGMPFLVGALGAAAAAISYFVPALRPSAGPLALLAPALGLLLQVFFLPCKGPSIRFVYLIRVPLLTLFALAAFGPVAFAPAQPLFGGILEIDGLCPLVLITMTSLAVGFACITQINLVRYYGAARVEDESLTQFCHPGLDNTILWTGRLASLLLPLSAIVASPALNPAVIATGLLIGALAAEILLYSANRLAALFSAPPDPGEQRFPIPFVQAFGWSDALRRTAEHEPPAWVGALKHWWRLHIWQRLALLRAGKGYFRQHHLLPGHSYALYLAICSFVLYAVLVLNKHPDSHRPTGWSPGDPPFFPTLVAVLLLLLTLSWGVSALAFLLDRFRVPVAAGLLGVVLATGSCQSTDHVFRVEGATGTYRPPTPADVLRRFDQPILVAAAGGGIQAGAWTTRVFQGLEESLYPDLRQRVALVSAVSGGSMGALYVGAYYDRTDGLHTAADLARKPSLDEVASALVGPDFLRPYLLPWRNVPPICYLLDRFLPAYWDRGYALERSWQLRLGTPDARIQDWSAKAAQRTGDRQFPAFLFNTTVVETGQPLGIATTQMPSVCYRERLSRTLTGRAVVESSSALFGLSQPYDPDTQGRGLLVATAARLSAAFPYVSPAAAPQWGEQEQRPRYHLVDGGYYDNYGLVGLSQWLDDALTEMEHDGDPLPANIPVLVIRGLQSPENGVTIPGWGWARQLSAPVSAFLATRYQAQWTGGNQDLQLLIAKWKPKTTIQPVLIAYPDLSRTDPVCAAPPLSWKLTEAESHCIDRAWDEVYRKQLARR